MTMTLFIASFLVTVLAGLGMALGVLAGRKPLCSGCVGLARLDGKGKGGLGCLICRQQGNNGDGP